MARLPRQEGRQRKKVADPAFFAEFEIAVLFGEPHPNHLKARLGGDEYDDLIAFLRKSKWFEDRARVREREEWADRTLADIRWLAGIGKLKGSADRDGLLPPYLRKPKQTPAEKARARAEAAAKIRDAAARKRAAKK